MFSNSDFPTLVFKHPDYYNGQVQPPIQELFESDLDKLKLQINTINQNEFFKSKKNKALALLTIMIKCPNLLGSTIKFIAHSIDIKDMNEVLNLMAAAGHCESILDLFRNERYLLTTSTVYKLLGIAIECGYLNVIQKLVGYCDKSFISNLIIRDDFFLLRLASDKHNSNQFFKFLYNQLTLTHISSLNAFVQSNTSSSCELLRLNLAFLNHDDIPSMLHSFRCVKTIECYLFYLVQFSDLQSVGTVQYLISQDEIRLQCNLDSLDFDDIELLRRAVENKNTVMCSILLSSIPPEHLTLDNREKFINFKIGQGKDMSLGDLYDEASPHLKSTPIRIEKAAQVDITSETQRFAYTY